MWNATLDLAFKELKDLVCKAPSLLLPDPSKPFEVETDASDYANKAERLKAAGLLHPLDIPNNKWESISMDFIVSHDAI